MAVISVLICVLLVAVALLLVVIHRNNQANALLQTKLDLDLSWFIFVFVLVLELGAGYYVNYIGNIVMGDASARVAGAFYVLYIKPSHLASIGFVWPPLPSLLEMPLLLFASVFKPLASHALAATIVTSFFAAGTVVLIYRNCRQFNFPNWATFLIIILYAFNPFIFIYGFNGMSEVMFIFFVVWTITEFTKWIYDERPIHLIWMGIALVGAFLVRFEAIALAAGLFVALVIFTINKYRYSRKKKTGLSYFEGTSLVVFVPFIAVLVIWILVNWIFMGDPLYFLTSEYSNEGQTGHSLGADILVLKGDIVAVLLFVAKKILPFIPMLVVIFFIRLFDKRLFKWETLMMLVTALSIAAMHYVWLFIGSSYGWFRFFVYVMPIAIAWLPYEFSRLKTSKVMLKNIALCSCGIALVVSGALTWIAMHDYKWAIEEYDAYMSGSVDAERMLQVEVAEYINQNSSDGILLLDSYHTWNVILNLDATDYIITTCSYDFEDAVESPQEYDVKYILTVDPETMLADAINNYYPDLYESGADWCTLEKDFGDYKLYKVDMIPELD
jgi:hypothetical protein